MTHISHVDIIPKKPCDAVNPEHYRKLGEYSALHVVEKWGLGYHLGQTLKYIQRAGSKPGVNPVEDLKKAKWYLERHIHLLDPSEPDPTDRGD